MFDQYLELAATAGFCDPTAVRAHLLSLIDADETTLRVRLAGLGITKGAFERVVNGSDALALAALGLFPQGPTTRDQWAEYLRLCAELIRQERQAAQEAALHGFDYPIGLGALLR